MPIGEVSAIAAALAWALGSLAYGAIGKRANAAAMNFGKLLTGALVLGAVQALRSQQAWSASSQRWSLALLAISGLLGLALGDTAYFGSIRALGAPRALLLLSASPVLATLLGLLVGEPLSLIDGAGIVLTLLGIGLVVYRKANASSSRSQLLRGVIWGLLSAFCQAIGAILTRAGMKNGIDPLAASAVRLTSGLLGMAVVGWGTHQLRSWLADLAKEQAWLKVAGAALLGTCVGVSLSLVALGRSRSVGVASTLLATSPVFMLPLAHVFGVERATVRGFLGAAAAVAGVGLLAGLLGQS